MRRAALGLTLLAFACSGSRAQLSADAGSDAGAGSPAACMATEVAFSGESICAADLTGRFRCFDGDATAAKPIALDAPVVALGASYLHHCALTRAGTVFCAGRTRERPELLGHGGPGSTEPVRVLLPREARALAVGHEHACAALEDGTVWCWGGARFDALGVSSREAQATPKMVPALANVKIVALAAGGFHTCAIDEQSNLWCWGLDSTGQLGPGARRFPGGNLTGPPAPAGIAGVSKAALGMGHSCALASNGDVACWGIYHRTADALLLGGSGAVPNRVPLPEPAIDLAAGAAHACAVGKSDAVYCWGEHGGTERTDLAPQSVHARARRIFAGGAGTCALTREGGLVCWGGITIHPSPFARPTPTRVGLPFNFRPVEISHGSWTVFARDDQGHVAWWGDRYKAGPPEFRPTLAPFEDVKLVRAVEGYGLCMIRGPEAAAHCTNEHFHDGSDVPNAVTVSAGGSHGCAVKADGTAWCWGQNFSGELGTGSATPRERHPVQVTALGTEAKDVVVTHAGACAIKKDGSTWCWGDGARSPVPLGDLPPVDQISFGKGELCLRATDGRAICGPLRADAPLAFAPLAALGSAVQFISTSGAHRCAITTDGALWCGGRNSSGELGLGHLAPVTDLVPVPGFEAVTAVTTGDGGTCALKRDGSLWCWGANSRGQLGAGSRPVYLGPVPLCAP